MSPEKRYIEVVHRPSENSPDGYWRRLLFRAWHTSGVWGGSGVLAGGLTGGVTGAILSAVAKQPVAQVFFISVGTAIVLSGIWVVIAMVIQAPKIDAELRAEAAP